MTKFAYKELDQEGLETLQTIAAADNFNRWMFETIRPFFHPGKVLEVGSGIGNISQFCLDAGYDTCLTDIRENYCGYLEKNFTDHPRLLDIEQLDLVDPQFEQRYVHHLGEYDTLFALNVIEHIEDDRLALTNCEKLLRKGGRMIILVPAYQWLYNQFDENLYHFRRYTRSTMGAVFEDNNIPILKKFHFNAMGILGWYVSGKLMGKETIPSGQMGLYNKLVPAFKLLDKVLLNQVGLSVIVVGEKA